VLLLVVGVLVGTIATAGRSARVRENVARVELHRIHRVAEAVASGRPSAEVVDVARNELRDLLELQDARFEPSSEPDDDSLPRFGRNESIELQREMRFAMKDGGRAGFELPPEGVQLAVLAHGQQVGRFVLTPSPGVATTLEERLAAVAIADQVGAVWSPP